MIANKIFYILKFKQAAVEGQQMAAYLAIPAVRSPVFAAMLEQE